MIDEKSRKMLDDDWAETVAELDYLDRLMRNEVGEEEEAAHRAKTIESIETGLARQKVMLERMQKTIDELTVWLKRRRH